MAAIAASVLVGCSGGAQAPQPKEAVGGKEDSAGDKLQVALLTPGSVNDDGWSAMAYDGLKAIESELGAEVATQEAKEAQIADAFRAYAGRGFDLVIGHGFEFNEPAVEIAPGFPETVFVTSSGGKSAPNAGALRFALEEAFYLAGMTAAKVSKSGTVGMVGGPEVPSIKSTFKAFRAGAESQGAKVLEVFTGSNEDVAKAKQATLSLISQGADVFIHQANNGFVGVFDACKERGALVFGANLNQNDHPTGVVLGSAFIVAKPIFVELAKEVQAKSYKGGIRTAAMADGAIAFELNPALKDRVPADVQALLDETATKIKSGEFKVPMDTF